MPKTKRKRGQARPVARLRPLERRARRAAATLRLFIFPGDRRGDRWQIFDADTGRQLLLYDHVRRMAFIPGKASGPGLVVGTYGKALELASRRRDAANR